MTVIDANGKVQASSGRFSGPQPPPAPDRSHAAREGAERSTEVQEISAGQILIAMLPIPAAIIVFMGRSGHMSARRRWRPSFQRPGLFNGCCFLSR
jgi:hypothetical protein